MRLYIVKAGDTLSSIAEKYGLELEQLLAINPQITNPDHIMPGMKIKIASGPVSVGPGQAEIGHPIHQTPQVQSPSVETPFMQFPIPAVEAGQSGTPLYSIDNQSTGGMSGQVGSPSMAESDTSTVQGSAGANVSVGSGETTGGVGENPPYLSTIPHHFAGNPLYSGLGANVSTQLENLSTQAPTAMMNPSSLGLTGDTTQSMNTMPSSSLHQLNQPYQPLSYPTYQSNQPYQSNQSNVQPSLSTIPGTLGVWPDSAYSWSTPFEQMSTMSANMPMPMYPLSNNASIMQSASNAPLTTQSANQLPIALQAANTMPSLSNMPIVNSMSMPLQTANTMPATKKKSCGCGGSNVGHYSLAQKRIAEGQAPYSDHKAETAENDHRAATMDQSDQEQQTNTVQSDDKPAAEIKQSTRRKVSKNRTSKRRGQKRQRSKAKIHRSEESPSRLSKNSSYTITVDDSSFGEHELVQNALDSRQPQAPWLNV